MTHYKPYSPEWHRKRYLKEALLTYLDDGVSNEIIYEDILDVLQNVLTLRMQTGTKLKSYQK